MKNKIFGPPEISHGNKFQANNKQVYEAKLKRENVKRQSKEEKSFKNYQRDMTAYNKGIRILKQLKPSDKLKSKEYQILIGLKQLIDPVSKRRKIPTKAAKRRALWETIFSLVNVVTPVKPKGYDKWSLWKYIMYEVWKATKEMGLPFKDKVKNLNRLRPLIENKEEFEVPNTDYNPDTVGKGYIALLLIEAMKK